jgi:mycothiol synthase
MITQISHKNRQYTGDADLQGVCDLLNFCDSVDKLDDNYAPEDLRTEFTSPDINSERDLRLWEDEEGRLVAFGQMWIPKEGDELDGYLYLRVHPDVRGSRIEESMISWGSERLREVSRERGMPAKLFSGTRDFHTYGIGVLEAHGFEPVRYWFKMERPLDEPIAEPHFPEGYTLRHLQGEEDVAPWVDCFNQSFIDHWNHHPVTIESHKHWLTDPKYRSELDLRAVTPDGTVAALCFCIIDPKDNLRNNRSHGWIAELGTRRGHRKIGLGTAMLLAGMKKLKAEGMQKAMLGVDAENPSGALRLYESVGFRTVMTSVTYSKEL